MGLAVAEQNLHFLRQGADLLRRLDDEAYANPPNDLPRAAGVGPHFRHCLDFYRCFLRDLNDGRIDYDRRERETKIEIDRAVALASVESIAEQLAAIDTGVAERSIQVRGDAAPFEDPAAAWHRSTVGRELRFLASHTVHHYALIAHILRDRGFEPGEDFGVAPATLAHWQAEAQCAP